MNKTIALTGGIITILIIGGLIIYGMGSAPAPADTAAAPSDTSTAVGAVDNTTNTTTITTTTTSIATAPSVTTSASSITRTTATIHGQITPNSSDTSYWFEYGEVADLGNTTALQSAGNGTATKTVSASLSSLKPLTKYYFRLNAQNQFGIMTGGTMTFTTLGPVAAGSPTVTTTNAGNVATSSATLRGHLNPNSYPTTYWFEYGTDSLLGNIFGSSAHVDLTSRGTATVTVSADIKSLGSNTKYYYQLVARNSYGTVRGDIIAFTTKR